MFVDRVLKSLLCLLLHANISCLPKVKEELCLLVPARLCSEEDSNQEAVSSQSATSLSCREVRDEKLLCMLHFNIF